MPGQETDTERDRERERKFDKPRTALKGRESAFKGIKCALTLCSSLSLSLVLVRAGGYARLRADPRAIKRQQRAAAPRRDNSLIVPAPLPLTSARTRVRLAARDKKRGLFFLTWKKEGGELQRRSFSGGGTNEPALKNCGAIPGEDPRTRMGRARICSSTDALSSHVHRKDYVSRCEGRAYKTSLRRESFYYHPA